MVEKKLRNEMGVKKEETATLIEVFDLVEKWLANRESKPAKVLNYKEPEELRSLLDLALPIRGGSNKGLMKDVRHYLHYSVDTSHPQYLNQLFGGFSFPAFIGELITSLTNTSMYTFEVAPAATLIEDTLIQKMLSYTGWAEGTGSFLTGGSNTNLVAMMLARNAHFDTVKKKGLSGMPKMAVFVSERSHFSLLKAANTLGIGEEGIIRVPVDENGRMRGQALAQSLEEVRYSERVPIMICATAGTTETGSFDALEELASLAEANHIWLHVDGSWGGSAILSKKRQHLFEGLTKADSFSWNPHKLMSIPLVCSVLLVKGVGGMRKEMQTHNSDYIYHEYGNSSYDLGPSSLQCGRRVDALKLWLAWKFYGDEGYSSRIEKVFALATYCTDFVQNHPQLQLLFPTQSLNVNFRFNPGNVSDLDDLNRRIRYRMIEDGTAMVNFCRLEIGVSIRLVLLNPDLEQKDMDRFFEIFLNTAHTIVQEESTVAAKDS